MLPRGSNHWLTVMPSKNFSWPQGILCVTCVTRFAWMTEQWRTRPHLRSPSEQFLATRLAFTTMIGVEIVIICFNAVKIGIFLEKSLFKWLFLFSFIFSGVFLQFSTTCTRISSGPFMTSSSLSISSPNLVSNSTSNRPLYATPSPCKVKMLINLLQLLEITLACIIFSRDHKIKYDLIFAKQGFF